MRPTLHRLALVVSFAFQSSCELQRESRLWKTRTNFGEILRESIFDSYQFSHYSHNKRSIVIEFDSSSGTKSYAKLENSGRMRKFEVPHGKNVDYRIWIYGGESAASIADRLAHQKPFRYEVRHVSSDTSFGYFVVDEYGLIKRYDLQYPD